MMERLHLVTTVGYTFSVVCLIPATVRIACRVAHDSPRRDSEHLLRLFFFISLLFGSVLNAIAAFDLDHNAILFQQGNCESLVVLDIFFESVLWYCFLFESLALVERSVQSIRCTNAPFKSVCIAFILAMINVTLLVALMLDATGAEGIPICWGSLRFKHEGVILMPRIFILGISWISLVSSLVLLVVLDIDIKNVLFVISLTIFLGVPSLLQLHPSSTGTSPAEIPQVQRYSMAIVVWSSFMGSFVTISMLAIEILSAFLPSVRPHVIEHKMQRASLQTMTSVCSTDIEGDVDNSWLLHKK